jgi:hypothetical protein
MLFSSDTTPEARRILIEIIRRQRPEQRLAIALDATDAARDMIRADLRARFPGANDEELHARFLERWLGAELARSVLAHRASRPTAPDPGA